MKIKNPTLIDRRCSLSIVPTYAILEVILKMEIIMENKFVKKPTPKGDKTTKIVFIGLLVALLFVIASQVQLSIPAVMQKTPCSKSP